LAASCVPISTIAEPFETTLDDFEGCQFDDQLDHGRNMFIDNAETTKQRETRQQRELFAQVYQLGILSASKALLESASPASFIDKGIGGVVATMQRWDECNSHERQRVHEWLQNKCGVIVREGERITEAVGRTVEENEQRKRYREQLQLLAVKAANYAIDDGEFFRQVDQLRVEVSK